MELLFDVFIRNKLDGTESALWSGINFNEASRFIHFAVEHTDPNVLPDYVIRPYVSRKQVRESYANMEEKVKVQKPQNRI